MNVADALKARISIRAFKPDPVPEALAWLYAAAALTGEEAGRERAAQHARELSAAEIGAAHKAGRARVKLFERQLRGQA